MPRRKPTVRPTTTDDGASDGPSQASAPSGNQRAHGQAIPGAPIPGEPATDPAVSAKAPQTAFDLFVERGLHAIYDGVLAEPIPDELVRLIEDDRRK